MGRPQDEFCWDNAEKLSDGKWKCKHCNGEFSGTADRIRRHLSGQGGGIGPCKSVPPNIRERASEEVSNKLSTNNISKRPRLSSSSVGEDYNDGIINVDRQGAIIGNTTVVAHVTQPLQGGCSSSARLINVADVADVTERRETREDPNLMTQRDNDDVNVDSRGVMMSNINATPIMASTTAPPFQVSSFDDVHLSYDREMSYMPPENSPVAVQVTSDPFLHAPSSSARLDVTEINRDTSKDPSLPCYSGDPILMTERDTDLYVTDALVKSLMCRSNGLFSVDFIKDPHFRIFLERARQYGVPLSLVRGESSMIERSLLNLKDEVSEYISMVKESRKETGCTMMLYNLIERKDKLSTLGKVNYVLGSYCPKGFIFFEQPWLLRGYSCRRRTFVDEDNINFICHDFCTDPIQLCEFSDQEINEALCEQLEDHNYIRIQSCLRSKIEMLCSKICERSEWAKGLLNKADKIHQYVADAHWCDYMDNKKEYLKGFENNATAVSRFLSIMLLEDCLKSWISCPIRYTRIKDPDPQVKASVKDSEFWGNGRALQKAINLILEIPDLFDTLVPSLGYVQLAINKAKHELNSCNRPRTPAVDEFWHHLDELLSKLYRYDNRIECAAYLNPVYFFGQVVQGQAFDLEQKYTLLYIAGEEREQVGEELQRYSLERSNPFAKISNAESQNTHPVKLWEKHGNDFPVLRKCAIKLLSQPASCMCNQVKKHMSQLEGADDLILRLNARMMQEFTNLGDNIYNPIDLEQIGPIGYR